MPSTLDPHLSKDRNSRNKKSSLHLKMLSPLPCLDPVAIIFLLISSPDCPYVTYEWTGTRTCLLS